MAFSCMHPPLTEAAQLLICRKCHAVKVEGVLRNLGGTVEIMYYIDATALGMLVDPALVGKRVRVTIEAVAGDETAEPKEVVTGN